MITVRLPFFLSILITLLLPCLAGAKDFGGIPHSQANLNRSRTDSSAKRLNILIPADQVETQDNSVQSNDQQDDKKADEKKQEGKKQDEKKQEEKKQDEKKQDDKKKDEKKQDGENPEIKEVPKSKRQEMPQPLETKIRTPIRIIPPMIRKPIRIITRPLGL